MNWPAWQTFCSSIVLLFLVFSGCAERGNPHPEILQVQPAEVSSRSRTTAMIEGRHFHSLPHLDLDKKKEALTIADEFRVFVLDASGSERVEISGDVTRLDAQHLEFTVPANLSPGSKTVEVVVPGGRVAMLADALLVLDDENLVLSIEDAADGSGMPVGSQSMTLGDSMALHAIGRRAHDSSFLFVVSADWQVSGAANSLVASSDTATRFVAETIGDSVVSISHGLYGQASTETLSVTECQDASDCADPCRSGNLCTMGSCVVAAIDKDSDGDGSMDAACGGDDCDDDPGSCGAACFPGNVAPDICDGLNQDCDGQVDENPDTTWFADVDGDGFGDVSDPISSCSQPAGSVANSSDCDDDPGACGSSCFPGNALADICDSQNQDCDASVDEDPEFSWFADADGDGFGSGSATQACTQPAGMVSTNSDCDDNPGGCGAACFPGNLAADECDGLNQDCDAQVDEDPELVWFQDADGDSFGNPAITSNACLQPAGFVADDLDCADALVADAVCGGLSGSFCNPASPEGPNGDATCSDSADNDCDTNTDEADDDCDATPIITLRFDNMGISETLINFPVLVTLTPSNFDYASADPLGADLKFLDDDGLSVLPHEIDVWNVGGTSQVWVLVPQIDANSAVDHIFLSYGDLPGAPGEDPGALWTAYHAVWHLEETGSGALNEYRDATSLGHHGQGGSGTGSRVPTPVTGKIGRGQLFDGNDDRIEVSPSNSFNFTTDAISIEYWAAPNRNNNPMATVSKGGSPGGFRTGFESDGRVGWRVNDTLMDTDNAPQDDIFHYVVVNWDGSTMRTYVDGQFWKSMGSNGSLGTSTSTFYLGRGPSGFEFRGILDEVRVINDSLSGPWIEAQHRTTTNSYITFL